MSGQAERVFELQSLKKKAAVYPPFELRKIFAFTSGKGGTGKTFLSVNIALALALMHKKVLLVDFDCNLSNVHILLDVIPDKTLSNYFLNRSLLPELIMKVEPNLSVIFGDSGMQNFPALTNGAIANFFSRIRNLEEAYDFILLDTASGSNKETLEILSHADETIVITSPEPTAVMDAYAVMKLLTSIGYRGEKSIVVNKAENESAADLAFTNLKKAVDHFLNIEVKSFGSIYTDAAVSRSIMAQTPLMKHNPESQAAHQINELASNLINNVHLANIQQAV